VRSGAGEGEGLSSACDWLGFQRAGEPVRAQNGVALGVFWVLLWRLALGDHRSCCAGATYVLHVASKIFLGSAKPNRFAPRVTEIIR
jgi:hypothetical protein